MTNTINEDSFFFLPVATLCRGSLITCGPNLEVVPMAQQMRDYELSGSIMVAGGNPVGMVTVRDCRNCIVEFRGAGQVQGAGHNEY